jgi:uroporphyrinogen decarboxylase
VALQAGLLFERLYQLRGFSETLVDLYENTERIVSFLDRLVDFQISIIRRLAAELPGKVHGFKATDDWGTQDSMFIHPDLWREIIKPRYRKIIDEVHRHGMHFWLHSDGQISKIIPDLIEIGIDVLDVPQPTSIFGAETLGSCYSGKVCFCLYTDIQSTLVYGTKDEIEEEAWDLVRFCSCPGGGGIIASDYPDGNSIGASLRNRKMSLHAFKLASEKLRGHGRKSA